MIKLMGKEILEKASLEKAAMNSVNCFEYVIKLCIKAQISGDSGTRKRSELWRGCMLKRSSGCWWTTPCPHLFGSGGYSLLARLPLFHNRAHHGLIPPCEESHLILFQTEILFLILGKSETPEVTMPSSVSKAVFM